MLRFQRNGNVLTVYLDREIDHHAASTIRREIDKRLEDEAIRCMEMDFTDVEFMDSSGIGMLIGRYKAMMPRQGRMTAKGMKPSVERIFRMGGLHRIIEIMPQTEEVRK